MVGTYCCVPSCFNSSVRNPDISFHKFPTAKTLRNKWLNVINRQGDAGKYSKFKPTDHHKVCGKHFKTGKKTYMDNIPSIFPLKMVESTAIRRPIKNREYNKDVTAHTNNIGSDLVLTGDNNADIDLSSTHDNHENSSSDSTVLFTDNNNKGHSFEHDTEIDTLTKIAHTRDIGTQTDEELQTDCSDTPSAQKKMKIMEEQLEKANRKVAELEKALADLIGQVASQAKVLGRKSFGIAAAKESPNMLKFYTGFKSYSLFRGLFDLVEDSIPHLNYIGSSTVTQGEQRKRGRQRMLTAEDELFLVLSRLRVGLLVEDLAFRYDISKSTVSRICCTWIDLLDNRLSQVPKWLSNKTILEDMPSCFAENYPNTRVILDCTEIYIEKPSAFREQSETYSQYKHHNTAKGLIGISPSGYITFVSNLVPGHVSDKTITANSGIIDLMEEGDGVMADRGFFIDDLLAAKKIALNIPPFLRGQSQLSAHDEQETRKIASLRIHVERAIERVKRHRILKYVCPISVSPELNKIWRICCCLVNFNSEQLVL